MASLWSTGSSLVLVGLAAVAAYGCSGTTHVPACPSGVGGATCNAVTLVGDPVSEQAVATAPEAGGGPLFSGTYVLSAMTVYTGADGRSGPTGRTVQKTVVVDTSGLGSIQIAELVGGCTMQTESGSFAGGSPFSFTATCPATDCEDCDPGVTIGGSPSGTSITFVRPNADGTTTVEVLDKM